MTRALRSLALRALLAFALVALTSTSASAEDRRAVHGEITVRGDTALALAPDPGAALGGGATLGAVFEPARWLTLSLRWRIAHHATLDHDDPTSPGYGVTAPHPFSLTVVGPELAVGAQLPVEVDRVTPFARAIVGLNLVGTCGRYVNTGCGGMGALVGGEIGATWAVDRNVAFSASAELLSLFAAYVDPGLLFGLSVGVLLG